MKMKNKYETNISKIEASDEFKNKLIHDMQKIELNKKEGFSYKIKKVISFIATLIGILTCGGVAWAAITGNLGLLIGRVPFSENYVEYQEIVENQTLEKDGTKIKLVSTICNEGFLALQFEVDLSEETSKIASEYCGLQYVSFNNEEISSMNYNLIIDGKEHYVRGKVESQIMENKQNKNYTVYQLYFLPSEVVDNKEKFSITLDKVAIALSEEDNLFIEMDGKFEVEVSKEKALSNTKTIENESQSNVIYGRLTHSIDKVLNTPMQTVIKVSSLFKDVTERNSCALYDEEYIGPLSYKVFDQNDNELYEFDTILKYTYYYKDGSIKSFSPNEEFNGKEYECSKMCIEEYIVTEKNENIANLRIEVYEEDSYEGMIKNIGTHYIDLNKEKINSANKNEVVEIFEEVYGHLNFITTNEIKYFDINIEEEYDLSFSYSDYVIEYYDDGTTAYVQNYDVSEEECKIIEYYVSLWGENSSQFYIVVFKDNISYERYCENHWEYEEKGVIDENNDYKVVLFYNEDIEDVKPIIDTIKLK